MKIEDMSKEEKWAELGRAYTMLENAQATIRLLKQSLAEQQEPQPEE